MKNPVVAARGMMVIRSMGLGFLVALFAQGGVFAQPPAEPLREHTARQTEGFTPVPANVSPPPNRSVSIEVEGSYRVIVANGIPNHKTGAFPNPHNPNHIQPQSYRFRVPIDPRMSEETVPIGIHRFGVAINGVPFDPGAAEWYRGVARSRWQYEGLSGAIPLGFDANNAHVQPAGAYHYHGLPSRLLIELGWDASAHSPIIGWAADGFPIYARVGFSDAHDSKSAPRGLRPSYRLRRGARPRGPDDPGGVYDGTFTADYEFVEGLGDLDECNGRVGVTPEFPEGTYAYFVTRDWPKVPRCFRGTPDSSFAKRNQRASPESDPPTTHPPPRDRPPDGAP